MIYSDDYLLMNIPLWVNSLPAIDAVLNSISTLLLLTGYLLIKKNKKEAHKKVMLSAFAVSVVFLACYLTHHAALHYYTGSGSKKFPLENPWRPLYLTILFSHIVLAATVPVLAIITIRRAWKKDWIKHRSIAKITFPIWLYVSITGVVIYFMLYHL
ncbi:Terminal oxidase biogenesis protein CtaM, putative heme A, heme O chaperone [hydrothermal vent metagenome]|uniref:Terminal oxidase biogenesis protein CtaM, putative heme A, heme O chaperone n=1 Tax=hydrothermal vent metagenome TaxID=652676 RepID=A0A3B1DVA0_9ZZZZ